jgi:hypothetical protein
MSALALSLLTITILQDYVVGIKFVDQFRMLPLIRIQQVSISDDGKTASALNELGHILLWKNGKFIDIAKKYGLSAWAAGVSPNGQYLAISPTGEDLEIYHIDSMKKIAQLTGLEEVTKLQWLHSGRCLMLNHGLFQISLIQFDCDKIHVAYKSESNSGHYFIIRPGVDQILWQEMSFINTDRRSEWLRLTCNGNRVVIEKLDLLACKGDLDRFFGWTYDNDLLLHNGDAVLQYDFRNPPKKPKTHYCGDETSTLRVLGQSPNIISSDGHKNFYVNNLRGSSRLTVAMAEHSGSSIDDLAVSLNTDYMIVAYDSGMIQIYKINKAIPSNK